MCGFTAQLLDHRNGLAKVTGSNSALLFFRLLLSSCLSWNIHCDDHSTLSQMSNLCFLYVVSVLEWGKRVKRIYQKYVLRQVQGRIVGT